MSEARTGPVSPEPAMPPRARPRTIRVLLVEDDPDDVLLIREMLDESEPVRFEVESVARLAQAHEALAEPEYDLILMDLGLPDSQGLDTFAEVRAVAEDTPIVVLTGLDDQTVGLKAVHEGAQDYLVKGHVDANLLARSACYAVERYRLEAELKQALAELDREFKIVADLQASFLPSRMPEIPGFDAAVYYHPAERAGGDYFDFLSLPGDCTGVLVADVSGHGAPAAVVMAMARLLVHTAGQLTPPGKVLAQLNDKLVENIPGSQFVTTCYGVVDPLDRTFTFALAGHEPPFHLDPATGAVEAPGPDPGPALGIIAPARYPVCSLQLQAGSILVLYTDGITECRSPDGEEFGEDGLAAVLRGCVGADAGCVRDTILAALEEHCDPGHPSDDTTFVVLQAKG